MKASVWRFSYMKKITRYVLSVTKYTLETVYRQVSDDTWLGRLLLLERRKRIRDLVSNFEPFICWVRINLKQFYNTEKECVLIEKKSFLLFIEMRMLLAIDRSRIFVKCFQYYAHSHHDLQPINNLTNRKISNRYGSSFNCTLLHSLRATSLNKLLYRVLTNC